jgi:hypothetical protein
MLSAASMVSAWGPKVSKTSAVVAGAEMSLVVEHRSIPNTKHFTSALGQGRRGGEEGPDD